MWGSTFVASKILLDSLSAIVIIAMRFVLASLMMTFIFRKEIKTLRLSDIKGGIIVGLFLFIAFYAQLFALNYTEPGKQAFLAGTYVVFVPFLTWAFSGIKPKLKSVLGVIVCFVGISFLTLGVGFSISKGDFITVFSSFFFAGHIIVTNHYTKKSTPAKISMIQFITVAVLSVFIVIVTKSVPSHVDSSVVLPILYLGLICTGVAYSLQTFAQRYTTNTQTGIILSLESVFGSLLSVFFYGELFTSKMVFGSILILISILISELSFKKGG